MKQWTVLVIVLTVLSHAAISQQAAKESSEQTSFVKQIASLKSSEYAAMKLAVAYYPERRTEQQWQDDFDKMKAIGISAIRIGEFSWSTLEPNDDEYHWDFLDKSIAHAQKNGLQVILCTPTATPPIWLVEKYSDVLPVDSEGRTTVFGARQHRDFHSKNYIKYSLRMVQKMAERYGSHPNVMAWQIDNELGGEQKWSFSKASADAFREYLKDRYKTIEELNARWMNKFWSMEYQRFDQINPPFDYAGTLTLKHHPSLELDFKRFSSQSIVDYCNAQAEILRKHITNGALITHNRFAYAWGDNVNSYELNKKLDIAAYDLYSEQKHEIAFYAELNTTLNPKRSWVLEYGTNSKDLLNEMEGMNKRGIEWICFFNWNPAPAGQEQDITSMLTITDRPTRNYYVLKEWNDKVIQLKKTFSIQPSGVGLYFDFESSWILLYKQWGKYTERLVYQNYLINTVYKSIFDVDHSNRIFMSADQIEGVHTLILPLQIRYDESLYRKLLDFVNNGGQLITTHDIFQKDNDNVFMTTLPEFYTKMIGKTDNYFYDVGDQDKVILAKKYGKGRVIIVNAKSTLKDWQEYKKRFDY